MVVNKLRSAGYTALEAASRAYDGVVTRPRATMYWQNTSATRYWRIALPAKYLPGKVLPAHHLSVRHYVKQQKLKFPQLRGDAAVLQFPGDNGSALCAMAMDSQGKRLLIECDDCYLDYDDVLWMSRASWGRRIGEEPHTVKGHAWIVEHSSGVIVTSRALAERYSQLNDNIYVCRNSIHPDDWKAPHERDNVFRIGWYASDSHDRDAPLIANALSWASRQPNVEIVNIGHDPGWPFARTQVKWNNDFFAQREHLRRLDVGVAPIAYTPLAKYRSDLKALEYAMGGAMPILQDGEVYWEWADKEFARICHSAADWADAIKWAVCNQDEVRARATEAREYVLRERTYATEIERWREAITGGEA